MRSEASKRADAKYKADKTTQLVIRFYPKDAELLAHLQKQESKQGYIKRLIREDMDGRTARMSFEDEYEYESGDEDYLVKCGACGRERWEQAHDLPRHCRYCGALFFIGDNP